MIINAHCLIGEKCNTCLRPLNPRWLWGVNALFAYGYEKIKLQKDIEYEYPSKGIKPLFMVVNLMKLDAHSISNS
jgi:hypothetical protein